MDDIMRCDKKQPRSSILLSHNGFTLLELIITTTLLAMILLILSGALRLCIRVWEKGEDKIADVRSPEMVLELIGKQIESTVEYGWRKDGKSLRFFEGRPSRLEFVTTAARSPELNGDIAHAVYKIDEKIKENARLIFFEEALSTYYLTITPLDDNTRAWQELISGLHSLFFQYAERVKDKDELVWQTEWRSDDLKGLPAAIRISIQIDPTAPPLSLIVPIISQG
jgi:general secretion pathway protein J